jgi:hypothetical protein
VLLLKDAPIAVAFVKGCAVISGHVVPSTSAPKNLDDGKI